MKRSEMVKILNHYLDSNIEIWPENMVSEMLSMLEKAGMQPPYSPKAFQRLAKIYIEPNANVWDDEEESK